ncbi:uncharacterized protein LOC113337761 isoform X2 [Papaver somniferum]|uniref:uncharacterized protein LOC113337761 isoform X2 n=1 Tax=Papaver somniferum TaxID=3469 RepID=UPI000E6FBE1B|nr:uncharacterized protein LOC113337761 isoform X2 [Papaver somniferum]
MYDIVKDYILYGMVYQNPTRNHQSLFFGLFPKSVVTLLRSSDGQGNCFVSAMEGSRIFFQSLNAAVLLFSRVTNIPTESLVLPVIYTNDKLTLGCELWDVHGQNQISHLLDLFNLLIRKYLLFQHWLQEQREYSTCQAREETCYTSKSVCYCPVGSQGWSNSSRCSEFV